MLLSNSLYVWLWPFMLGIELIIDGCFLLQCRMNLSSFLDLSHLHSGHQDSLVLLPFAGLLVQRDRLKPFGVVNLMNGEIRIGGLHQKHKASFRSDTIAAKK